MLLNVLKGKIHRATVVQAELNYVGSITIDEELMEAAGIMEYEKVQVVDVDNGNVTGDGWSRVAVNEVLSTFAQYAIMPAFSIVIHQSPLVVVNVDDKDVLLDRAQLIGLVDNAMMLLVKSENVHDNPFPLGNLLQFLAGGIEDLYYQSDVYRNLYGNIDRWRRCIR